MVRHCKRLARQRRMTGTVTPLFGRSVWALLLVVISVSGVRGQVVPGPPNPSVASQPTGPIPRTDIAPMPGLMPVTSSADFGAQGNYVLPQAATIYRPYHYFQRADMPPGSIGQAQLLRGGPLPGYFQPVEISAPEGTQLALAMDGTFEPPLPAPLKAGLLVGSVYRLRVTSIPFNEGQEIFPSIEIINRLYPPQGLEARYPIPIQLTREELELALRGQFVIRVIYLENPQAALPLREDPNHQSYFEVGAGQDPLEVADGLGRPMVILRIGSRVPELDHATGRFLFESPPWIRFPEVLMGEPTEAVPPAPSPAGPQAWNSHQLRINAPARPTGVGVTR